MLSGVVLGPMNTYWYRWLDRTFALRTNTHVATKVGGFWKIFVNLEKVILDWLSCPAFSATYWASMALQEGTPVSQCLNEYLRNFKIICLVRVAEW